MDTGKRQICFYDVLYWMAVQILERVRKEEVELGDGLVTDVQCEVLLFPSPCGTAVSSPVR